MGSMDPTWYSIAEIRTLTSYDGNLEACGKDWIFGSSLTFILCCSGEKAFGLA